MVTSKIRRSNMLKLREATRMAMTGQVMLAIDVDHLMTISMSARQEPMRLSAFQRMFQVLGVFSRVGDEPWGALYMRMYDEAMQAGASLGMPEVAGSHCEV